MAQRTPTRIPAHQAGQPRPHRSHTPDGLTQTATTTNTNNNTLQDLSGKSVPGPRPSCPSAPWPSPHHPTHPAHPGHAAHPGQPPPREAARVTVETPAVRHSTGPSVGADWAGSGLESPRLHVNAETGHWEVSIGHMRYGVIPGSAAERDLLRGQSNLATPVAPPLTKTAEPESPPLRSPTPNNVASAHPGLDQCGPVSGSGSLANRIIEQRLGLHSHFGGRVRMSASGPPLAGGTSDGFESSVIHTLAREMGVFKKPHVPARFQASPEELRRIVQNIEAVFEDGSAPPSPPSTTHRPPKRSLSPVWVPVVAQKRPATFQDSSTETLSWDEDVRGFHCRLCPSFSPDQRAFYFHLKTHYEDQSDVDEPAEEPPEEPDRSQPQREEGLNASVAHIPRTLTSKQSPKDTAESATKHSPEESLFDCRECQKDFRTKGALRVHARIHKDERPYPCDRCAKSFRQISDLNYHRQSLHSRHKSFACDFCHKTFSRKYSLTLHRRIHTKECHHICDVCQKAFRAAIYLTVHKRSHTDERPYECEVCSKAFRTRADMTRHLSKVHHSINKASSQSRRSTLIAT
ncbi:hypothetical protein TCAL_07777 [Tigriopus californicus]|uniref:Zinc finger protein 865 n=1 Tax=Tigriopus californicus TaxID=6832 RepID=A0A553P8N7_TIGCA|nr:hypothetical protein TCAL_07777 [Tigriopus californicus]|eukprot:TCALIF_07777-PA protein Name:"Similar to Znf32 Zinc finger protein 32 (Mus musculus)" AED:0.10 eAED:0.10 QI:0/0.83/0.71/0.85/0.83/0.71/7/1490/574